MITITKKGKFYVPIEDGFIGYAGDNLNKTIKFLVEGIAQNQLNYRAYLKFDDGTVNYFLLEKKVLQENTELEWQIKS